MGSTSIIGRTYIGRKNAIRVYAVSCEPSRERHDERNRRQKDHTLTWRQPYMISLLCRAHHGSNHEEDNHFNDFVETCQIYQTSEMYLFVDSDVIHRNTIVFLFSPHSPGGTLVRHSLWFCENIPYVIRIIQNLSGLMKMPKNYLDWLYSVTLTDFHQYSPSR